MGNRTGPPLAALLFLALSIFASASARPAHAQESPLYLALGDSLAFGVGATNPAAEGYVGLTHFALENSERYEESGLDLENLSVPGATSEDLLEPDGQLDQALEVIADRQSDDVEGNEAELISIDIGGNDLLQLAEPDSPCVESTGSEACRDAIGTMLRDLQENLTTILSELHAAAPGAPIFVIDLYNPYSGTGLPQEVLANVAVQQVNGIIAAVTFDEALGAELVPIFELFEGRAPQWIASDQIHPNDFGHIAIAEALLAAIQDRPIALPSEVVFTPTDPEGGASPPNNLESDGDDMTLLLIAVPLAFIAGAFVSATFFWARGRN